MVQIKRSGWLPIIGISLVLPLVIASPVGRAGPPGDIQRRQLEGLEIVDPSHLIKRQIIPFIPPPPPADNDDSDSDPNDNDNVEDEQTPKGDGKDVYHPEGQPMELPENDADYGDDRFPPREIPKRSVSLPDSLVERQLPKTAIRKIKDKVFGELSIRLSIHCLETYDCIGKLYAEASIMKKKFPAYYRSRDEKGLVHFKQTTRELPDKDKENVRMEVDHNIEIQEVRRILQADRPKEISEKTWSTYNEWLKDDSEVSTRLIDSNTSEYPGH